MNKIKVLMVGNDPSVKGGITSVISQLLAHDWDSEGIDMQFIPTYINANNAKKVLYFTKAYCRIQKRLQMKRPDVVHIHMSYRGSFQRKYEIHKLCKKNGIPDIIHLHGSEFKQWYDTSDVRQREKIRTLLQEADAVIVLGDKWNRTVKEIAPTTNTVVVSNTVHIPDETACWNEDRFQVLFLGVLIQRKGAADLLRAVKLLKDTDRIGNLRFVIAGDGEKREVLHRMANENSLGDIVRFTGWITGEEKARLLRESQMLVLPSYNEGLPVSVLEAVSYGMPVVATDVGDVSFAVRDGENGYLIAPGDTDALANSIFRIASDRTRYESMGKRSRNLAERTFSDDSYFKQIADCYKSVIS